MIDKLIDFNVYNIWNYLILGLLSIIILFITQYVNILFKYKETNKRKDYFLHFLRSDETIDECINKLKEKSELKTSDSMMLIEVIGGYFVSIILFIIIMLIAKDFWLSVSILALINIFPLFFIIKYIKLAKKNPLEKTYSTLKRFRKFKYFILFSNLVILALVQFSYLSQSKIELISIYLFMLSIGFLLITSYALIKGKEVLIFSLKYSLNELYLDRFPYICIKVINDDLCGKLQNIFDDNLIILYHTDQRIAIEWDKIITMSINEKTIQSELDV